MPPAIGAALGLRQVAPFILVAMGSAPPERYPDPARHLPRPPNNHLSYAITWYGLAVAARGDLRALGKEGAERMTAYDRLAARFERIATLGEASAVLNWDAATMMPPGGGAARGDQLAVLAGLSHSLLVASAVGDDLAAAEAAGEADPWRAANLRLMRHMPIRARRRCRADLVEARARANSTCEKVWREARRRSDFAMVRPHLEEVVRLMREAAAALAPALGLDPYDALMDGYQRGMRTADVATVFAELRNLPAAGTAAGGGTTGTQPAAATPSEPISHRGAGGAVPPLV